MGGTDNIRGIDYQITASVLLTLHVIAAEWTDLLAVRVESLNDEEEDLSFAFAGQRSRQVQIKKLVEGYNWTPSSLRPTVERFATYPVASECVFVTDGSASRDLVPLRHFLQGTGALPADVGLSERAVQLAGRVRIETRFFPSPHEYDPAACLRVEVDRVLISGPFSLAHSPAIVRARLWDVFVEAAKSGVPLTKSELANLLADAGITPSPRVWSRYPTVDRYYPQDVPVNEVISLFQEHTLGVAVGIGGTGKTTLAAEAATQSAGSGYAVCWVTANELLQPQDLLRELADYYQENGDTDAAAQLRVAEPAHRLDSAVSVLRRTPSVLIVDRFEAAGVALQLFIEHLFGELAQDAHRSALLLTSRMVPDWWPDIERTGGGRTLVVGGLTENSALEYLADFGTCSEPQLCLSLARAVGCHPQSLSLLTQLANPADERDLAGGMDAARDWVLRRVLDELPDRLRLGLARMSIFDYPAHRDYVISVLGDDGPDILRGLAKRDLVRLEGATVVTHDSIRAAALGLISPAAIQQAQRAVADHMMERIEEDYARGESVMYEQSIRWAAHLEAAGNFAALGGRFPLILNADKQLLQSLFGVLAHGFPFEFDDSTLDSTWDWTDHLISEGLIEETPANRDKDVYVEPPFQLSGFSFIERLLVDSRCRLHEYGNSLGYIEDTRPNFAFAWQDIFCPWEHCIELSPFPPMTRGDYEAALNDARARLADPEQLLSPEQIQVLEDRVAEGVPPRAPEAVDPELRDRSCPVFGHCCPGGTGQAHVCRQSGHFEWADDPGQARRSTD